MVKIIISAGLIVISVFIYAKLSRPLINTLKFKESQNISLKRKIMNYKNQFAALKTINNANIVLKKQKVSTYMFTLLSFTNYLKSKGFSLNIKLNKMAPVAPVKTAYAKVPPPARTKALAPVMPLPVNTQKTGGFKPYEINTKFAGVKKMRITLTFKGYPGITDILSVMDKLYILFPIKYTNFKINSKITVINFNLYSFKGV